MPCLSLMHIFAARANQKRHKLISVKLNLEHSTQAQPATTVVSPALSDVATVKVPVAPIPMVSYTNLRLKLKQSPRFIAFARTVAAREQQKLQNFATPQPQATVEQPAPKSRAAERKANRLAKAMAKRARKDFLRLLPKGRNSTRADLINAESQLGSTIFGPVPAGHRREFFHDHQNIWIWHEDWYDATLRHRQITVRYEVRISGIYKKVAAGEYYKLEGDELSNFRLAARVYLHLIKKYLYFQPSAATN